MTSPFSARIVEVSDAPLRRVIKQLGGWPVADPTWDPNNTLPLEQLIAVLKRNFTLGVIIEEWVGPDDRNSLGHVIQVSSIYFIDLVNFSEGPMETFVFLWQYK